VVILPGNGLDINVLSAIAFGILSTARDGAGRRMVENYPGVEAESALLVYIRRRYGEMLDMRQLADFYRYPSVAAVRKARQRGTLPVAVHRFRGKRGYFAKAGDVAKSMNGMISVPSCPPLTSSGRTGKSGDEK